MDQHEQVNPAIKSRSLLIRMRRERDLHGFLDIRLDGVLSALMTVEFFKQNRVDISFREERKVVHWKQRHVFIKRRGSSLLGNISVDLSEPWLPAVAEVRSSANTFEYAL